MKKLTSSSYTIDICGLEMLITRKPVKNVTVRIKDGIIAVSAPENIDETVLADILTGQAEKFRAKVCTQKKKDPEPFADGKPILFLGKEYIQRYTHSLYRWNVSLDEEKYIMYISCPSSWKQDEKKEFFRAWYCEKLAELLEELIPKWENAVGLYADGWTTGFWKTRWGCCNPVKKTVAFNGIIAQAPVIVIESVILHELLHLRYPNHQRGFHEAFAEHMPEAKACDEYLKRFANLLM